MTAAPPSPLPIRWLDDDLVVCSKPAGMSVHKGPHSEPDERFLLQTLGQQIGRYLYPVHRLDRNTSGLVAYALSRPAAARLQQSLQDPATVKEYLVLVRGAAPDRFASRRWLTGKSETRQPSHTTFRTIAHLGPVSLVAARIHTGRMHQIRRHLNHLGRHVVGDTTHGKGRINALLRSRYGLPRMFLHAWRLTTTHPTRGEPLALVDPLPADLADCLARLSGGAEVLDWVGPAAAARR